MSDPAIESFVERIHGAPLRLVLVATGGGSQAISDLLTVSGASRSILEAAVPYSAEALAAWLGARPDHFCSSPTARAMAMVGLRRAQGYEPQNVSGLAGVSCTASLASDRPKHGPHRAHLALQTAVETVAISLDLKKGLRTRRGEEQLVARLILNLIAEACGLDDRLDLQLADGEQVERVCVSAPAPWQELLAGRAQRVAIGGADDGTSKAARPVIFPGAFNPLHAAHRRMVELAEQILGRPVELELSIANVDKPPLDFIEMERRTSQFAGSDRLWLTRAATFVEKARLFGGPTFVVGADTMERIADPRYYGGHPAGATAAIDQLIASGCDFLVFGRVMGERFRTLSELNLPAALTLICREVPAAVFREEVSSTALRRQAAE